MRISTGMVVGVVFMLFAGAMGATGVLMYQRHNMQHAVIEQFMQRQEQINQNFAQAINALAAQRK